MDIKQQTEHWFYHLESATLESVLPDLLEKVLARGWTALVKTAPDRLADLDNFLWTYRDDAFLPHGRDDEPQVEHHPIRLSSTAQSPDGVDVVVITDGSAFADLSGVTRLIFMINGRSQTAVAEARKRWKQIKQSAVPMSYWQQDGRGQWVKKA